MWFVTLDCEVMNLFTGKGESGGVRVTAAQRAQSLLHTAGRWGPSWQTDCNYPAHTHLYTLTHLQQLHTIVALRGKRSAAARMTRKGPDSSGLLSVEASVFRGARQGLRLWSAHVARRLRLMSDDSRPRDLHFQPRLTWFFIWTCEFY